MSVCLIIDIGIGRAMGARSKLGRANPNSTSLQIVIPKGILEQTGWKDGDFLDWELIFEKNGKAAVVRKAK